MALHSRPAAIAHGVAVAEPAALGLDHREPLEWIRSQRRAADAVEQVPAGSGSTHSSATSTPPGAAAGVRRAASARTRMATTRTGRRVGQAAERRRSCHSAAKVSPPRPPRTLPVSPATVFRERRADAGLPMPPGAARAVPGTGHRAARCSAATATCRVFPATRTARTARAAPTPTGSSPRSSRPQLRGQPGGDIRGDRGADDAGEVVGERTAGVADSGREELGQHGADRPVGEADQREAGDHHHHHAGGARLGRAAPSPGRTRHDDVDPHQHRPSAALGQQRRQRHGQAEEHHADQLDDQELVAACSRAAPCPTTGRTPSSGRRSRRPRCR